MTSQIKQVRVDLIDANPWRDIKKYPFVATKIDALVRSIKDVGLWEGVIARKAGRRYELAFGHHRIQAAKKARLKTVPLVIRDLDDEEMLGFMGRENLEDYNADFLCMLESWDAAVGFARQGAQDLDDLDIARLLGWTRLDGRRNQDRMNDTASACAAASELIAAGHLTRGDLEGLSVKAARQICTRTRERMTQIERMGRKSGRSEHQIKTAQRQVARGAKRTAEQVREEAITSKQVRGAVDSNTHVHAAKLKAQSRMPLFAGWARSLENQISKMLYEDSAFDKLEEMIDALPSVELDEDRHAVLRVVGALDALAARAAELHEEIVKKSRKNKVIDLATQRQLLGEG